MHDDADETIERIAEALRPLPAVDPAHRARVLVAVAAERERDREARVRRAAVRRAVVVAGGIAAAGVLAWAVPRALRDAPAREIGGRAAVASVPAGSADVRLATRGADERPPQAVELVFRAPHARQVSIVGDFNGWNLHANAMTRDAASGLWSGTIAVRPGRHVYAFVVDDSIWAPDPRSPRADDADFGRPGSVLLVGRP